MKNIRHFLLFGLLFFFTWAYSQNRVTFTENFDGKTHGFSIQPTSAWIIDSSLSASGKQSCWGFVPNNTGDSIILLSPLYDLTSYSHVYLRFTHICKVSESDIVSVEYREDFVGSQWTRISNARYQGATQSYRKQRTFNEGSYLEWVGNDMMAEPDNSWWKTESFDISEDVSYAKVQFRFKIVKGSTIGTQFAWGWLIDNFELTAATNEIRPPVVEFVDPLINGTIYGTGPFQITAKAARRTLLKLETPILRMTFKEMDGSVRYDSAYMHAVSGDSIWIASIPQQKIGTRVDYSVFAKDTTGNTGSAYSSYMIGRKWGFDSNSVAINRIDTPRRGALAGVTSPVVVTIENRGLKTLSSATIHWEVNGVSQTSINWTGNLLEGFSEQVSLGTYTPRLAQYDTITAWVSNPNGEANTTADTLLSKVSFGCTQILGGDYIVGPTGQFSTINDALEILSLCGTSGNVTLKLQDGVYTQGIKLFDLHSITGTYDILTITSLSGNAEDVILQKDSTQSMVINIARSHNIVISNVTLDVLDGTVGVRFTDTCNNIEVSNCIILLDTTTTVANACIHKDNNGKLVDNIRIYNNVLNGGYYGIYFYGTSSAYNTKIDIVGNTIKNSYYYGIYMYYNEFKSISDNTITTRPANMTNNYTGVYLYYNRGNYLTKNRIRTFKAVSDPIGMYIYYLNYQDTVNYTLIANNEIITHVATTAQDGITLAYTSANIFHNSILRTGMSAGAGIWLISSPSNLNIRNNNIVTEGGYPIYLATTSYLGTTWFLDYNNYYATKSALVGYAGGGISDMNNWRMVTRQDSNSVSVMPSFLDTSENLMLSHYTNLDCPIDILVPYDILDSGRVGITAMGAYTPQPASFDVTVLGSVGWQTSLTVNNATPITALFMNVSAVDTLRNLTLNWSVNGVLQSPKNWVGLLLPYETDTLYLGDFLPIGEYNHVNIWLSNPNGQSADMNTLNDTSFLSAYGCLAPLSGTYTIGETNADFSSIADANMVMALCGIGGPVVFELEPGIYGNVTFSGSYLGSDSINTVTFTSASGKADSVIFTGSTNGITITNVSNLTIKNITVDAFNINYGIRISDSCYNLEISHCNIILDPTVTSGRYGIYYYNTATASDNIRLIGNKIDGGYYGIYFYSVSQSVHSTRVVIDSNILTNQYYYATYFYYTDFISVSHNILEDRSKNTATYYYGLRFYYCNAKEVIGNKITSLNTASPYGMYLYYVNCFDTIPMLLANNDIRISTTGSYYGIYLAYSLADIYHNSILTLGTGAARGLYMTYSSSYNGFFNWYNNNFVSLSGAASYPVYLSTTSVYTADYNNYYSSGTYLGYVGGGRTNLTGMQTYGYDMNSVNVMPIFVDSELDLRLWKGTGLSCPLDSLLPNDREGKPRGSTTFMGAYEENPLNNNVKLVEFSLPQDAICTPGDSIHVKVVFMNRADSALHKVDIHWTLNGVQQTSFPWTGNLASGGIDSVYLGVFVASAKDNKIVAYSSLPNGYVDDLFADDTIKYSIYGCSSGTLSGTYTVGTSSSDFFTLTDAITALINCGIGGPVVLNIEDGSYDEIYINGTFPGGSATNTVTFQSVSGNKNNVVIGATSVSGNGMTLENAAYLKFENITFGTMTSTTGGVVVQGTLTSAKFLNCNLYSTLGATAAASSGFYRNASTTSMITGLEFKHCVFKGGSNNIYMINGGTSSSVYGDVLIDSCDLIDASYAGISMWYPDYVNFTIKYNNFSNYSGASTYYAIRVGNITSYTGIDTCIGNRIRCTASGTNYGIMVGQTTNYGGQLVGKHAYIANNEIIIKGGSTQNQGLHFENLGYIAYYANSVHIEGTGGTSYGFYMTNTSTSHVLKLKYNNFYIDNPNGTAYTVWHSAGNFAPGLVEFDYNNYYTTGPYVASNYTSLAAWKVAANDPNSLNDKINFIDYPNSLETDGKRGVIPVSSEVLMDINDSIRFSYTTTGCYHDFEPSMFDAKLEEITAPFNGVPINVSTPVNIKISNVGGADLDSVEVHWTANGVLQTPYYWKGDTGLPFGATSTEFTIGNFSPISGQNKLVVWVENPNGFPDGNVFNDTMTIYVVSCDSALNGKYTVGTPNSDFPTLAEAIDKLLYCAVNGPVVMELASGLYEPIDIFGNISGASATNTITFTSASGNAGTVVIGADASTALKLTNSSHFIFTHVTIGTTTTTTSKGVELSGYCENVHFYGCNIYASTSATSSAFAAVYYRNSSSSTIYLRDVSFIKNNISGGYYNMYIYYPAGSSSNMQSGAAKRSIVRIDSNVLTDAYYYGIYSYYYGYYPSISYNQITSRSNSNYYYAMNYYYNTVDSLIGNKIKLQMKSTGYGIYSYYLSRSTSYGAQNPAIVANNEIIATSGTTVHGIYRYRGQWNFANNSLYLTGSTNNYGINFYNSTAAESFAGTNNIIVCNGPTGSNNYPIYTTNANYVTTTEGVSLNYNDYYSSTSTVAYAAVAFATLSDWVSAYMQDMNSVSLLPSFTDATKDLSLSIFDASLVCYRNFAVGTDINKAPRTLLTTMGAYATPLFEGFDLSLESFAEPLVGGVQCFPEYTPIKVKMYNQGIYSVNFVTDPVVLHFECVSDSVNVQSSATISFGSLSVMTTDVYEVYPSLDITNPGLYRLKVWLECASDQQAFNDTVCLDYYVEKSLLPYDNDFSQAGTDLLYVNQVYGSTEWAVDSNTVIPSVYGNRSMIFPSSEARGSISQSLFTSVSLQGTYHPRLQFWYLHDNNYPTKRDQMEVKISTDGGATFVSLMTLLRYNSAYTTPTWRAYQIDLSNYAQGSCIIISFVGYSHGGGDQAVDRIRIIAAQDMILSILPPHFDDFSACDLDNKSLSVVMANQTNQPIPYNDGDSITVDIQGPNPRIIKFPLKGYLTGKLEGSAIDTIEIATDLDFSLSGTYDITVYTNAIDSISSNDTDRVSYSFLADLSLSLIQDVGYKDVGDTVYPSVNIVNTGTIPVYSPFDIRLNVNGKDTIIETITDSIEVGDTLTYTFNKGFVVPPITLIQPYYFLNIGVALVCDGASSNNKKQYLGNVNFIDLSVDEIVEPTVASKILVKSPVYVQAYIYNRGTFDVSSVKVHVSVDSAGVCIASFSEMTTAITAETKHLHTFTTPYYVPNFEADSSPYIVRVFIEAADDDLDLSNDTLSVQTFTKAEVGISTVEDFIWTLGQNIPNPAQTMTEIPYAIPVDGKVNLKIVSVSGQVLYQKEMQATAGNNSFVLDIDFLANGIYYYSMEYAGRTIVKKMTIQK